MIYRFRRDWKVILVSVLVIVAVPIVLGVAWYVEGGVEALIALPIWFVVMVAVILRTPRYFYIEKDHIVVQFFIGHKLLDDIQSVRPILKGELKGNIKTWGNGGLMGYTGHFENRYIGKYQMYAVNKRELALVTLNNGAQYVINYPRELLK